MLKRLTAALLIVAAPVLGWAQGTIAPTPVFTAFDSSGNPISSGKLCTYVSGSTTPANTYTSSSLAVANSNPIVMNAAGRPNNGSGSIFLTPGQSYKFVLRTAGFSTSECTTGTIQWSADGISGVPTTSGNLETLGTAGEALTAGNFVYLSDGSGSKTQGQWYKADPASTYSSTAPAIGMVPSAIASGVVGSIRLAGQATGLSSLSIGSRYFLSASGAISSTAPVLNARSVGQADSATTLVLGQAAVVLDSGLDDFRLTLTTAVPVTITDVTAATTVYWAPYHGNRISLYNSVGSPTTYTSGELSVAVPATTATLYDVFVYPSSGVPTLELLAWTNDTTRATALVNTVAVGIYTKSGDPTRRYVGSVRTTGVSGQTEDSLVKRYLYNAYNQVPRPMQKNDTTANWTYTTATWHQANAAAGNQLDFVLGLSDQDIRAEILAAAGNTNAGVFMAVGIGLDSTSAVSGQQAFAHAAVSTDALPLMASYHGMVAVGRHTLTWLEYSVATGTTTFYGFGFSVAQSGITGTIRN